MFWRRIRLTGQRGLVGLGFFVLAGDLEVDDDFFAVLQIAIDGLVAAGNDLAAFGQAIEDFHEIIVADAALDGGHRHVIALDDKDDFDGFGQLIGFFVADGVGGGGGIGGGRVGGGDVGGIGIRDGDDGFGLGGIVCVG